MNLNPQTASPCGHAGIGQHIPHIETSKEYKEAGQNHANDYAHKNLRRSC
jgi:hypothetical protein